MFRTGPLISDRMFLGSWPLLVAGFGILLVLMVASGVVTWNKAANLYANLSVVNREYRLNWNSLNEVRSGIHVSSVLVRDYLLDPSQSRAREIRDELLRLRKQTEPHLSRMENAAGAQNQPAVRRLRSEIQSYWESLDPVFDWSPQDKQAAAYGFLRQHIMPRRESVLSLADEVQTFMDTTFHEERQAVRNSEGEFRVFLERTVGATVALGFLVAALSILRVRKLEVRAHGQQLRTEVAEDEMRRLSHQVVQAQEEERRSISRELHDEVGQMLTGLRMDLRALQKVHRANPAGFDARIDQTRALLEQTLQSVRDIAMGLRPSMLDDLGLRAALEWQARDFERRHEIAVTLEIEADIDSLPERHRTNLYRIVQEALTNCARHARAHQVRIRFGQTGVGMLTVTIEDDGIGMEHNTGKGLGLIGIKERVRKLGGDFRVESLPGQGTRIALELPEGEAVTHG
ncbi:MAG: histidine kinase [Bryobacteraceae bacterium]|nr:histidine kinase [Bryobacteraceae bacterium]